MSHVQKPEGYWIAEIEGIQTYVPIAMVHLQGRLTGKSMDALQVYYGGDIRNNGDIDKMYQAI